MLQLLDEATQPQRVGAREVMARADGTGSRGTLPHISVMIPTANRHKQIARCLHSLEPINYPSWDLTVVDQSHSDATRRVVESFVERLPNLTYRQMVGPGSARARNMALHMMHAPIVAFLDDDCTVTPNWLEQIAAAFARHPDAVMIFGRVFATEHNPGKHFIPVFEQETEQVLRGRLALIRLRGMGASMYVRRDAALAVGCFDIHTGAGARFACEDWDLAFRILRGGGAIVLTPSIQVEHHGARAYENGSASRMLNRIALSQGAMDMKFLRCGDPAAIAFILARIMAFVMLIRPLNLLSGRGPTHAGWLFWYIFGLVASLQFSVNRKACLWANHGEPVAEEHTSQTGLRLGAR